jgi:hypothetical protein
MGFVLPATTLGPVGRKRLRLIRSSAFYFDHGSLAWKRFGQTDLQGSPQTNAILAVIFETGFRWSGAPRARHVEFDLRPHTGRFFVARLLPRLSSLFDPELLG